MHVVLQQRWRAPAIRGDLGGIRVGVHARKSDQAAARHRLAGARLSFRPAKARRRHGRGNFRPLQSPASAPAEIAARASDAFRARHRFRRTGGGRLRRPSCSTASGDISVCKFLPAGAGTKPYRGLDDLRATPDRNVWSSNTRASDSDQPAPKLYVPVTEAHLVSKYVGTGKARPPLNTLGGTRWAKAKAAGRASRARCRQRTACNPGRARIAAWPCLSRRHALAARIRRLLHLRRNARPDASHHRNQDRHGIAPSRWIA